MRVREMRVGDVSVLSKRFADIGWHKPAHLFETYLDELRHGLRNAYVVVLQDELLGYATLKWHSDYASFAAKGIPEISDLNVLPAFQRMGVATRLLDVIESAANERRGRVGLAVGLTSNYGAAQRLYVKRGYIPDGAGITHKCLPVSPFSTVCADDDLVLWMIKKLREA